MAAATLEKGPELRRTLSLRMKDVYERTGTGQSLDKDYGENVGGPPKNRRAGRRYLWRCRAHTQC